MVKESFFKRFPWLLHLLLMVGVSAVILVLVFIFIRIYARQGEESEMPDIVGKNIAEVMANNELELDFVVLDSIFREGTEGGTILTQDPLGGTMVKNGRKVYVSITAYNVDDAVLPELAGLSVRQAVSGARTFRAYPFPDWCSRRGWGKAARPISAEMRSFRE